MLYANTWRMSAGHPQSLMPVSWTIPSRTAEDNSNVGLLKEYPRPRCLFHKTLLRLLSGHWDSTKASSSLWMSGWCWPYRNSSGRIPNECCSQEEHYHQFVVLKWNTDSKSICFVLALVSFYTHAWNSLHLYPGPSLARGIQHLDRENWILNRFKSSKFKKETGRNNSSLK